jgi:hypothetical protein
MRGMVHVEVRHVNVVSVKLEVAEAMAAEEEEAVAAAAAATGAEAARVI